MDTLSGEVTLTCFIPLGKGIHPKRKEFAPKGSKFFPFRTNPFPKGSDVQESKQVVTQMVSLVKNGRNPPSVSSHLKQ